MAVPAIGDTVMQRSQNSEVGGQLQMMVLVPMPFQWPDGAASISDELHSLPVENPKQELGAAPERGGCASLKLPPVESASTKHFVSTKQDVKPNASKDTKW